MGPYGTHHVEVDSWVGDIVIDHDDDKIVILKIVSVLLHLLLRHHEDLHSSKSNVEPEMRDSVLAWVGCIGSVF